METIEALAVLGGAVAAAAALGFWIWMLIDCLRHESRGSGGRMGWLAALLAAKLLGAVLYYFLRRRPRLEAR